MKIATIDYRGRSLSAMSTMSAFITFYELTGHDYSAFDGTFKDVAAFVYACCKAYASRHEEPFDITFAQLCDWVEPKAFALAFAQVNDTEAQPEEDGEAKKKKRK